jgi:hypothetical protein
MKTFSTSGTGNQQTLSEIESDKIPVYDSVADAEADLANLADGQIGATADTGSELSAPTDTVQSGNMHAVTSNAVAQKVDEINAKIRSGMTNGTGAGGWVNAINLGTLPAGRYQFIITPTNVNTVALNTAGTSYWAVGVVGASVVAPMIYFPDGTGTDLNLAIDVTAGTPYGINITVIKVG